jgi:uncharacterized damage-inducible protein DinB
MKMETLCSFVFVASMLLPGMAAAQDMAPAPAAATSQAMPASNTITMSEKGLYGFIAGSVIKAAQKMPEENYSFKPTPEVRSFGQLIGHEAEEQYFFCALATGDNPGPKDFEKSLTTKADLVAALQGAVAYCNKQFAAMTDAKGAELTKFMGFPMARMTIFSLNTAHTDEHYGNIVTYMRLKGLVPPTSEQQQAPATTK